MPSQQQTFVHRQSVLQHTRQQEAAVAPASGISIFNNRSPNAAKVCAMIITYSYERLIRDSCRPGDSYCLDGETSSRDLGEASPSEGNNHQNRTSWTTSPLQPRSPFPTS
jgi:hypothetical protein